MPRPQRVPGEKPKKMTLSFTEAERRALWRMAGEHAKPITALCREILLKAAGYKSGEKVQ